MKIQNFDTLAVTDARKAILRIAEAGLEAIDTNRVMRGALRLDGEQLFVGGQMINLREIGKLVFVAIGKCSAEAATVAEEILGDRIARGVVVDVKVCPFMRRLETFCGTHPLPSSDNLAAAEAILRTLEGLTERDVVIFVISGGGSTLLFLPENKANREETTIFNLLTEKGATIQELNIVRKHISLARGGHLARCAYPARVVSLIFSDVRGDDIAAVASGPTVRDTTTMEDAVTVLGRFDVLKVCPIENCGLIETPKEDKYFERVSNVLVVSNGRALEAMREKAESLGFAAKIRSAELKGEAIDVARMISDDIHAAVSETVLLWGGETTVKVRGTGIGGRNLTVSASALGDIKEGEEILSIASDGRDHGLYAGAICDTITKNDAVAAGIDVAKVLENSDTYPFFEKIGNYLVTGDTGSNVSDLVIALKI